MERSRSKNFWKNGRSRSYGRKKVYVNDYVTVNVNDESIARENNRVFVNYTTDFKIKFYGDTYNKKESIKELASKYKTKANWTGKVWEIDTEDIIEDNDLVKFLNEILEKYDYSYKTARKIKRDIKEFS